MQHSLSKYYLGSFQLEADKTYPQVTDKQWLDAALIDIDAHLKKEFKPNSLDKAEKDSAEAYLQNTQNFEKFVVHKGDVSDLFSYYASMKAQYGDDYRMEMERIEKTLCRIVKEALKQVAPEQRKPIKFDRHVELPEFHALYDPRMRDEVEGVMLKAQVNPREGKDIISSVFQAYTDFRIDMGSWKEVRDCERKIGDNRNWSIKQKSDLLKGIHSRVEALIEDYQVQKHTHESLEKPLSRRITQAENFPMAQKHIESVLEDTSQQNDKALVKALGDLSAYPGKSPEFLNPEWHMNLLHQERDLYKNYIIGKKRPIDVVDMHEFLRTAYGDKAQGIIECLQGQVHQAVEKGMANYIESEEKTLMPVVVKKPLVSFDKDALVTPLTEDNLSAEELKQMRKKVHEAITAALENGAMDEYIKTLPREVKIRKGSELRPMLDNAVEAYMMYALGVGDEQEVKKNFRELDKAGVSLRGLKLLVDSPTELARESEAEKKKNKRDGVGD